MIAVTHHTTGVCLAIGHVPERKQIALYTPNNGDLHVLAYFVDADSALFAAKALRRLGLGTSMEATVRSPSSDVEKA